jgi:hypothetical protein
MMVVSEEIVAVRDEGEKCRLTTGVGTTSREWYFRVSGEYFSILISDELDCFIQYVEDVETHARNLCTLWMTDPFQQDEFVEKAVKIIERSDSIEDNVGMLKNSVIRFMHADRPDWQSMTRPNRVRRCIVRRRMVRRRISPVFPENQYAGAKIGGIQ